MVRLKHKSQEYNIDVKNKSQFHYGSIKTIVKQKRCKNEKKSQFHYGSIKTCL